MIVDSKKKILFLTCRPPYPLDDGWKIRCFHLIKSYADHGWEIDLITFISSDTDKSSIEGLAGICRKIITASRAKSYSPSDLALGLLTRTPFPALNYTTPEMSNLVGEIIRKNHYDLIQIEDIMMCNNLGNTQSAKIVLDMHNVQSELMRRYALNERNILKKIYAWMTAGKLIKYETKLISTFKAIFVCSEEDRQLVLSNTPTAPVVVIPNGVDRKFFSSESKNQELDRIVFTGDLGYHANRAGVVFFVEKIFPLILRQYPSVRFYIVGKNPPPQISAYANDAITVTGMVADVRPYLESAKVVVVPLLSGGGTRLKILEAMAMGKAIVSTSLGSEGIPAQHNKHILLADEPEEFAQEVCMLLKDERRRRSLGDEACNFVKTGYDWNVIGTRIVDVSNALLEQEIAVG